MFAGSTNGSNQISPLDVICNPSQINICLSFVSLLSLLAFVQHLSHNLNLFGLTNITPKGVFDQNLLAHLLTQQMTVRMTSRFQILNSAACLLAGASLCSIIDVRGRARIGDKRYTYMSNHIIVD